MGKFYVTTAIAYVNASPHIGFALELIQADVLARYHRLKGDETFYLTGVDEHGVKIYETAKEAGMESQKFADMNAEKFKALKGILNLSNDDFIRTTSDMHKKGAKKIWQKMFDAGDLYKDKYKGNYCVGCEAFILDKDLDVDGNCPIHKKKPKVFEEENYFFKLSKYSDKIRELIEKDEMKVVPVARKNEMLNIIGEGLKDVSFSRPKDVLPWGIDVPNDDSQVMYVWCDALSNYITGVDYEKEGPQFKKFWPCDAHLIGKDILRFHAGIWIGMLLSAGVKLPKSVYVHGFITSEGQKMSKSIGNVVDPLVYVDKYGADSLRYFLMKEIPTTDDGDFSHKRFIELYNSELANGFGNLVNRVVMMTDRYLGGKVPKIKDNDDSKKVKDFILDVFGKYGKFVDAFDIKLALEAAYSVVDFGNKYIDEKKPWAMAKENDPNLSVVLYNLLEIIYASSILLLSVVPAGCKKVLKQLGKDSEKVGFDFKWGNFKESAQIEKAEVLFPRIEE
ncbi:MAG: methionine--tRNA ligase [Candidatus Gracilibacteria bacterium]|jgi:methionyl-tRNA synthetase